MPARKGHYVLENVSEVEAAEKARELCGEGGRYSFGRTYQTSSQTSTSSQSFGSTTWTTTTTYTTTRITGDLQCDLMTGAGAEDPDSREQAGFCYAGRGHRT